jgi:hypothetical protein
VRDEIARYAIGVALGAAIGALMVWHIAHDDADRVLRDWETAAVNQQAAERKRTDAITRRIEDDHTRAVSELRRRLLAGWRPAIPSPAVLPAERIPAATAGPDAGAPDHLLSSARLAACQADRERLIADGAEATLQLLTLQAWVSSVSDIPTSPDRRR